MSNTIDLLLYRKIRDGKQYDKLFPKSTCKSTYLGEGMTDYSVDEMADMVRQYSWQTEKVAPLLQKGSLQETCNAIHEFLYWHFQYKADGEDQYLRSLACSWFARAEGIDCKSYSILASCILANLGIAHYIRRIKQPGMMPDLWTHVYVVVPVDQKTGSLAKGLYTIDGTIATTVEPIYTEKSDLNMMKHYGLNAAVQGLNGGVSLDFILGNFAAGWTPSCIGGSMNASNFNDTFAIVAPHYNNLINAINNSARTGAQSLITDVNSVLQLAAQLKSHSELKMAGKWSSSCSKDAVKAYNELAVYYYNIFYQGFWGWLTTNFDVTYETASVSNVAHSLNIRFDKGSDIAQCQYTRVKSIKVKATTTELKAFELTPYVATRSNQGGSFNLGNFMNTLKTVIAVFKPQSSGGNNSTAPVGGGTTVTLPGGSNNGSSYGNGGTTLPVAIDPNTGQPYGAVNNVKTAGGGVMGIILVAAGAGLLISGMKTSKPGTAARKTTSKPKSK